MNTSGAQKPHFAGSLVPHFGFVARRGEQHRHGSRDERYDQRRRDDERDRWLDQRFPRTPGSLARKSNMLVGSRNAMALRAGLIAMGAMLVPLAARSIRKVA